MQGGYATYDGLYNSLYWTTAVFSHAIVSLLLAFTLFAAAALDVMRELRAETNTDPLSGLLNRRGFERAATDALSRHAAQGIPAAIVITDLDHFKAVNDMFGHAVGDKVIVAFAELLRSAAQRQRHCRTARRRGVRRAPDRERSARGAAVRRGREASRSPAPRSATCPTRCTSRQASASPRSPARKAFPNCLDAPTAALYNAKKAGRDRVRLSYQHVAEQKNAATVAERRRHRGVAASRTAISAVERTRRSGEPR